jgi:predicted metalloprotease with PDZ domain
MNVTHRLSFPAPHTHLIEVETTIEADAPLASPLTLFMPVWSPGSYLVREYARHVEGMRAEGGATVAKVRKNGWTVDAKGATRAVVRYRLYANELTVRTNHLDETHAFLNSAAVFLAVEGHEGAPATVKIDTPKGWRVATALPQAPEGKGYVAANLDTLVDSPIEVGVHRMETFDVLGVPHRLAVWPSQGASDAEVTRLVADTRTILETEAKLFGGLPYDRYLFILHLSSRGRGGLEHASSAALLASPAAFMTRDGYLDLLSLVAHEAFHAWNVKRLRPQGLTPYRYQEENYTRLLWWFEGATSYFDWRILRLAKLCTVTEYLDHLAGEIGYLDGTYGRLVHSLEEASFDAWIKLYRPDENSPNSSVSYYRKGELVNALMDIEIRARSGGKASLDGVLAYLWESYGAKSIPVPEGGMQAIFEKAAGVPLQDLFDAWIRSPGEIEYGPTLEKVGLAVERSPRSDPPPPSLGVRIRNDGGKAIVASVLRDTCAFRAGIDPGDEILAVAGRRVEGGNVDAALRGSQAADTVEVTLTRDGKIQVREVTLDPARPERVRLVARRDASEEARARFAAWLGETHPAWSTR